MYLIETNQIYGFSRALTPVVTPGLAPEPLLRQGLDLDLVDHVVGQILNTCILLLSAVAWYTMYPIETNNKEYR